MSKPYDRLIELLQDRLSHVNQYRQRLMNTIRKLEVKRRVWHDRGNRDYLTKEDESE